jgi:hypothetical protein
MPKRLIDFDALWSSRRLSQCTPSSRVEYLWIYGLADASGSFEMTNLRAIWGRVAAIRPDLTIRKLKACLEQFEKHGLLFVWTEKGKKFGHWVGSRKEGRLPPPSTKSRYYLVCPLPPVELLENYDSRYKFDYSHDLPQDTGLGLGLGLESDVDGDGKRIGFGAPSAQSTAAKTAAASSPFPSKSEIQRPIQNQELQPRQVWCSKCSHHMSEIEYVSPNHRCWSAR